MIHECTSAVEKICELSPDVVFLDVQMPGMDGFDVLRTLPKENLPGVIFLTAYEQHAVEAFRLEALDYVLKPVERGRLAESIERARRVVQEKKSLVASAASPSGAGTAAKLSPAPRSPLDLDSLSRNARRTETSGTFTAPAARIFPARPASITGANTPARARTRPPDIRSPC